MTFWSFEGRKSDFILLLYHKKREKSKKHNIVLRDFMNGHGLTRSPIHSYLKKGSQRAILSTF